MKRASAPSARFFSLAQASLTWSMDAPSALRMSIEWRAVPLTNFSDLRGALPFYASGDAAPRRFVSSRHKLLPHNRRRWLTCLPWVGHWSEEARFPPLPYVLALTTLSRV